MRFDTVRSLVRVLTGLLVAIIGYGMYRSPELNWNGFIGACLELFHGAIYEINRFIVDPFAALGFVLIVVGLWMFVEGFKNIILSRRKKLWDDEITK